MTEHAAAIFVFFFLAEYASIVLICILNSILFLGGYNFISLFSILEYLSFILDYIFIPEDISNFVFNIQCFLSNPLIEGLLYGLILGIKSCIMIFTFI
jgi:NADH-ubiquinone oxidoreductase chain 1